MAQTVMLYTRAALFFFLLSSTVSQPSNILDLQSTPQQQYPAPLYSFALCMEITNRLYSPALLDPSTPQYRQLYAEVTGVLDVAFNCSTCDTNQTYQGMTHVHFTNKPLVANCTIWFRTIFINNIVIKYLFLRAVDNTSLPGGIKINGKFTSDTVTPMWLFPKSTTAMGTTAEQSSSSPFSIYNMCDMSFIRGLPGWIIAMLVFSCVMILLLFIIMIVMCCWCCRRKKETPEKKEKPIKASEHVPYERKSFKEHLANPMYTSHSLEKNQNFTPYREPDFNAVNPPAMYMMNPGR